MDLKEGNLLFNLSTGTYGGKYRNSLILRHDYTVVDTAYIEDNNGNAISLVKIR